MARATVTWHGQGEEWVEVNLSARVKSPEMLHDLKNRTVELFSSALKEAGYMADDEGQVHTADSLTAIVAEMEFSDEE